MNYSQFLNCTVGNASIEYSHCLERVPSYENCPDPTICEVAGGGNVGLAFGLTIGAGLATTIGALLPFLPFVKRNNTSCLAASMALAAGVMLYVSFTEIRTKALNSFCCVSETHYDLLTTSCFFGGVVLTILLDCLVWALQKLDCGCNLTRITTGRRTREIVELTGEGKVREERGGGGGGGSGNVELGRKWGEKVVLQAVHPSAYLTNVGDGEEWVDSAAPILMEEGGKSEEASFATTPTASSLEEGVDVAMETGDVEAEDEESVVQSQNTGDGLSISMVSNTMSENTNNIMYASVNELFSNSSLLRMNAVIVEPSSAVPAPSVMEEVEEGMEGRVGGKEDEEEEEEEVVPQSAVQIRGKSQKVAFMKRSSYQEMIDTDFVPLGPDTFREVTEAVTSDKKQLKRMGLLTCLAIALHNFPEGLATFVATLSSPSLGGALALAIALHNIPEGVCVSMPVYYATGSKVKAFSWAFLSGISEPLAAILGWLLLKDHFGPLVYAISFGIIGGMMVYIALKELLPTSYKFEKNNQYIVPVFLIIGMFIMAMSLLLFLY